MDLHNLHPCCLLLPVCLPSTVITHVASGSGMLLLGPCLSRPSSSPCVYIFHLSDRDSNSVGGPTAKHHHRVPQRPCVAPLQITLLKHWLVKGLLSQCARSRQMYSTIPISLSFWSLSLGISTSHMLMLFWCTSRPTNQTDGAFLTSLSCNMKCILSA